jgi:hypothetical protein
MGIGLGAFFLAVAGVISAPFFRNAFEMRRQNKREMVGSIFWGTLPFLVVLIVWAATGDLPMRIQPVILGVFGAVVGAAAAIYLGYVARDAWAQQPTPPSGTSMAAPPSNGMGNNNTLVGVSPPASLGNGNTIVGPTDTRGNTIINQGGTAIGAGACADGTSVAIGAGANAGNCAGKK